MQRRPVSAPEEAEDALDDDSSRTIPYGPLYSPSDLSAALEMNLPSHRVDSASAGTDVPDIKNGKPKSALPGPRADKTERHQG